MLQTVIMSSSPSRYCAVVHTRYCNDISCFYRVIFNWNKVRPQENANYTIFINLNLCTYTQNTSSVEILVTIS